MARKTLKLLLAAMILSVNAGCWDAVNIEDRDISTAVVVDYRDGEYAFYVEVASITSNLKNMKSEDGNPQGTDTDIVMASGKSFAEARINLDKELNKPIFLGAVQALIMTEGLAEQGITEYAFRMRQMVDYRKTMDVIVITCSPEEFLNVIPVNESTVGFAVEDTLQSMINQGATFHMSLADLLEQLVSKNPCYLISTLSIVNDKVTLTGYTIFTDGRRQSFIPYDQSRGIIYFLGTRSTPEFDYVVPVDGGHVTMGAKLTKLKITPDYQDGEVSFAVSAAFKVKTLYPSSIESIRPDIQEVIRQGLMQQIVDDFSQTILTSQEYGDYLSFSEAFRIRYPDEYEQLAWEDAYKKAEFSISVSVEIQQNESVDYDPKLEGK